METISVAPVATPVQPQAAAPQPSPENGASATPFDQALKQELAKPDNGKGTARQADAPKAEAAKAQTTPKAAAAASTLPQPVDVASLSPELAAMLETAGLVEADEATDTAVTAELGAAATAAEEAPADLLAAVLPAETPVQPFAMAIPAARTESTLVALAQERQVAAAALEIKAKPELPQHLATAPETAPEEPQLSLQDVRGNAAETLAAAWGAERAVAVEAGAALSASAPTFDSLASVALAGRWTPTQALAADIASAAAPASARIDTPLGESAWGEAFQQKIVWLVDRQQQSAELHVNPAHLGPIEVMLDMAEDGTHIAFSSPHAAVREAIEASLGDLRESLGDKGLSLGEAFVSADSKEAREQMHGESRAAGRGGRAGGPEALVAETVPAPRIQRGLVDLFA